MNDSGSSNVASSRLLPLGGRGRQASHPPSLGGSSEGRVRSPLPSNELVGRSDEDMFAGEGEVPEAIVYISSPSPAYGLPEGG